MAINRPTGETVIIVEWVLLFTAALLVAARLYLRLKINHQSLTTSDVFVILAWFTSAAYSSCDTLNLVQGFLRNDIDAFFTGADQDAKEAVLKVILLLPVSFLLQSSRNFSKESFQLTTVVDILCWNPYPDDILHMLQSSYPVLLLPTCPGSSNETKNGSLGPGWLCLCWIYRYHDNVFIWVVPSAVQLVCYALFALLLIFFVWL